jgi:hypothetical protein
VRDGRRCAACSLVCLSQALLGGRGGDGDGEMCPRPTATARRPVYSRPRRGRTLAIAGTDRCAHLVDVLFALFASCNNRLGVSIPN